MQKCFVLENIAWQVRCSINIMQQVPSIFGDKTLESVRNTLFKLHWELTTSIRFTQKSVSEWNEPFARHLLLTEYRCLFTVPQLAMYSVLWFWTLTHTLTFWVRAVCARGQFGSEEKKTPSYFIARPVLMETPKQQMIWNWLTVSHVYKRAFFRESRADWYPVAIYLFLRWEKIGVWLKPSGTHGKGRRKNSDS